MQKMVVDLDIHADAYLALYKGFVRDVVAVARDGRSIRFPADSLRKFVTPDGIQGTFTIVFDESYKLIEICRV